MLVTRATPAAILRLLLLSVLLCHAPAAPATHHLPAALHQLLSSWPPQRTPYHLPSQQSLTNEEADDGLVVDPVMVTLLQLLSRPALVSHTQRLPPQSSPVLLPADVARFYNKRSRSNVVLGCNLNPKNCGPLLMQR
ncbi:uncharacterized protein LOC121875953 isoform X2 [Homarus americanus]|uniref:uncharacterized protein LOC121875953 isoform X2 n=1 Tax=Homarus americanus TaxID=6706 RepID=UPI001C45A07F|nr:uncharacterized protein LOC121875953 isoform X2 [Homarus americanus]